ncbi:hypothetical protein [Mycobacterium palustre]|uniref:Prolyl 4-hydroxylase alpha subunit Fe(2+) 2OG dioxygenase domain-containing protein n=1 Tax=Mycobacterium palustre TaxID=153971 RepID=A0A1X1ZWZ0_9MYCO|nr:hypothetical protein [Mycobacterium palustre]MCV7100446.1 hypothetical protein [Mycobacterium palustre]ORW28875.1 hypothetical protein AWC19_26550 [Mycobacterium palustre]
MSFTYLLDKLDKAEIRGEPFPHVYIEDFLDGEDFEAVMGAAEITLPAAAEVNELFARLDAAGYQPIDFPGCTKSRAEYIAWLQAAVKPKDTHPACEAKGMALRCMNLKSEAAQSLDAFFRSPELQDLLTRKFGITAPVQQEGGVQKYLNGYEISPHPDMRQKALTWMLNVNPGANTEDLNYHTHYMTFKPEWDFVRRFWRDTPDADTCWVPWQWCDTKKRQTVNNSIVVFSPRHDTLHAVRAHYDHLPAQRTQFCGNLWYQPKLLKFRPQFQDFADGSPPARPRSSFIRSAGIRLKRKPVAYWTPPR